MLSYLLSYWSLGGRNDFLGHGHQKIQHCRARVSHFMKSWSICCLYPATLPPSRFQGQSLSKEQSLVYLREPPPPEVTMLAAIVPNVLFLTYPTQCRTLHLLSTRHLEMSPYQQAVLQKKSLGMLLLSSDPIHLQIVSGLQVKDLVSLRLSSLQKKPIATPRL